MSIPLRPVLQAANLAYIAHKYTVVFASATQNAR
jgi:hypothetical protein